MKKNINGYYVHELGQHTIKAGSMIDSYNYADNTGELYQVYSRCSIAKHNALNRCKDIQNAFNGFGGRITGCNSSYFTYGFKAIIDNVMSLVIITYSNIYVIPVDNTYCE